MAQELERWLEGDRTDAAMAAHLASCAACQQHRIWLRTERDLFAARARADRAPLPDFDAVLARMQSSAVVPLAPARERSRRHWVDGRAFALSLCAAAALLCVMLPQRAPESPLATPEPRTAPAAVGLGAEDVSNETCVVQSCCADDSACATSEHNEAEVAVATAPEASACGERSCGSPDRNEVSRRSVDRSEASWRSLEDRDSTTHAAHVTERPDLTCSEDL
jgi:hypothetical protein